MAVSHAIRRLQSRVALVIAVVVFVSMEMLALIVVYGLHIGHGLPLFPDLFRHIVVETWILAVVWTLFSLLVSMAIYVFMCCPTAWLPVLFPREVAIIEHDLAGNIHQ